MANWEEEPHDDGWFSRERLSAIALLATTAVALYLCYRLVVPFLPALAWALALAVVARPIHRWLEARIQKPALSASLTVLLVAVFIIGPSLLVIHQLVREATSSAQTIQEYAESGRWRELIEQNPRYAPALHWVENNIDLTAESERLLGLVTNSASTAVTTSVWVVAQLLITLFTLFYFFRDRPAALRGLRSMLPLTESESNRLFHRVAEVIHATIYGTVFVALVQGALGGLMFWFLGLPAPLMWGVVMGLLAIVPVLGAFVVWAPAALFLAIQGEWGKALLLTGWGTVVVGMVDNLLYPMLVGKELRLHTLLVFFAVVGGLGVFGASGLIIGPVILAVTLALVDLWKRRTADGRTAEASLQEAN